MDNSLQHHKPKAFIVLDSSALADLLAPSSKAIIPEEQKMDDNQPRHVDWLVALAKQGIEIIIPEEIAFAAGNVFLDGENVGLHESLRPDDDMRKAAKIFLRAVGIGAYPNIHIMPVPDGAKSPNADIMRKMRKLHLGDVDPKEAEQENIGQYTYQFMKRPLNNEIIPDALRALPKDIPVFVLHSKIESAEHRLTVSMDGAALNKLNPKGMLLAIKKSGLMKEMGHSPTTRIEHIMRDIKNGKESMGLSVGEGFGIFAQDTSGDICTTNNHPFATLLSQIMRQQGAPKPIGNWQQQSAPRDAGSDITR